MSLLAPLYFLGAMAVGLPILFHLIRRRPKTEVQFSSLMFLRQTPPRLTRKSRLDNLPLLLLRALALTLLAIAFSRPFWRSPEQANDDLVGRRIVMLIDTSASMRREDVWQQTIDKSTKLLADLQITDQLSIVSFDDNPKTILSFEECNRLPLNELRSLAKSRLMELSPSWKASNIGQAVSYAADMAISFEAPDMVASDAKSNPSSVGSNGPMELVLISDMQVGSQIESLQTYNWPDELKLDIQRVASLKKTNATAQILVASASDADDQEESKHVRVRVTNSNDASDSHFLLNWFVDSSSTNTAMELPVQVPPGQSRVVRMPLPPVGTTSLLLQGDDHDFDNTRYLVNPEPQSLELLHLGDDDAESVSDPGESLVYFLQRVPLDNQYRRVSIRSMAPNDLPQILDPKVVQLIVIEQFPSIDVTKRLREYAAKDGRVLVVLSNQRQLQNAADTIGRLAGSDEVLKIQEAIVEDYVMLTRINFSHPIFEPMSDPQFNDFTKIKIWSHRKLSDLDEDWKALAHFDDGDPALIERPIEDGKLWVLATGWQPQQSQLALSTKFIPLIFSFFDKPEDRDITNSYTMGERMNIELTPSATMTGPSGLIVPAEDRNPLQYVDQPGIYTVVEGETRNSFAVNLNDAESRTEPLSETALERFGIILGKHASTAQRELKQRQLRDMELEKRQRLWQWLLVAALSMLLLETWLGGWISRRPDLRTEMSPGTAPTPTT